MDTITKLHAVMSLLGRYDTAKKLNISYPKLMRMIDNPSNIRLGELEKINNLYDEKFKG